MNIKQIQHKILIAYHKNKTENFISITFGEDTQKNPCVNFYEHADEMCQCIDVYDYQDDKEERLKDILAVLNGERSLFE